MALTILHIGDIVGRPGREAVCAVLPDLIKETKADLVIANGENAAHGTGITAKIMAELFDAGIQVLTTGDHAFRRQESATLYEDRSLPIIRPANFPERTPGQGWTTVTVGTSEVVVANLIGRVFMKDDYDDPFRTLDRIIEEVGDDKPIIVDFHAEATSEKVALGWHADGRVVAIHGTHTHIPTADERILPKGTAYITDIGMAGPQNAVLGVKKDIILYKFLTQMPKMHEVEEEGPMIVNAVVTTIDPRKRTALSIARITKSIASSDKGVTTK